MKMETTLYSETVVSSYQTTRCRNPETLITILCLHVKVSSQ